MGVAGQGLYNINCRVTYSMINASFLQHRVAPILSLLIDGGTMVSACAEANRLLAECDEHFISLNKSVREQSEVATARNFDSTLLVAVKARVRTSQNAYREARKIFK